MWAAVVLLSLPWSHGWAWDATPAAAGYLWCWSERPHTWTRHNCLDAGDALAVDVRELDELALLDGPVTFFLVVAYEVTGQLGDTGSGPIQGVPAGLCECP